MLKKTMDKEIRKALDPWLKSIKDVDEELGKEVKKKVIVTGGCFASMILGEAPKDYDLYFTDEEVLEKVAKFYTKKFNEANRTNIIVKRATSGQIACFVKSKGVAKEDGEVVEDTQYVVANYKSKKTSEEKYRPTCISSNAISLSEKIQIVLRFHGDPDKIHENYDFEHTKAYWTYEQGLPVIPERVWELVTNKTLVYTGSLYPLCSLFRMRKFINRGWHINAGQIFKAAYQVSKLNLDDIQVLEDQLTGVDSYWFRDVIERLQAWHNKHPDADKEDFSTYLIELIDKIF